MAKPSIFISHSAKDDFAIQVRDTLYAKLVEMGFNPLMDKERLEPGAEWRKMIREWIQQSDAAIILFSKDALDSPWVLFEATTLLTRREEEQTFDVFPVRFASVSREELDKSKFAPLFVCNVILLSPANGAVFVCKLVHFSGSTQTAHEPLFPCKKQTLPDEVKKLPMSTQQSLWLNNQKGLLPCLNQPGQHYQEHAIGPGECWPLHLSTENDELLA